MEVDRQSVRVLMQQPSMFNVGLVISLILLSFCLGYYIKWRDVRAHTKAVIAQAESNQSSNDKLIDKMQIREYTVKEALANLGLTDDEINLLYQGEDTQYNKLKSKFTEYLPGKTKWLKGDTVYVPRKDCADDYLGVDEADKYNSVIIQGRDRRLENQ